MKPAVTDLDDFMKKVSWEIDALERTQPVITLRPEERFISGKQVSAVKQRYRISEAMYFRPQRRGESKRISRDTGGPGTHDTYDSLVVVGGAHYKRRKGKQPWTKQRQRQRAAIDQVVKSTSHSDVRKAICAVLSVGAKDAHEISNAFTPTLLALALTGAITIPPNPLFFAVLAIYIARMGVAAFCKPTEVQKED